MGSDTANPVPQSTHALASLMDLLPGPWVSHRGRERHPRMGEHYWRVFLNEGDGFGPVRERPVPDGERFEQVASNLHATFDINGDGLPHLVNAGNDADFEPYGSPGDRYWLVFLSAR